MPNNIKRYHTVADARAFAAFAYFGLEDKNGLDYLAHPVRVMETVKRRGYPPYVQIAALLHDVIEDTVITAQMMLDLGFHRDAVDVIVLMTRTPEVEPDDYYRAIREHPGALAVKLADIEDNTDESRLSYLPPKVQERLRKKYAHALEVLTG